MESTEGLFGQEEWTGLRIKTSSWELWHFYIEILSEGITVLFVRRDMSSCTYSFGMVQLWVIVQISVGPTSNQLCQHCPDQQQALSISLCMLSCWRVLLENSLTELLNFSAHWFFVHLKMHGVEVGSPCIYSISLTNVSLAWGCFGWKYPGDSNNSPGGLLYQNSQQLIANPFGSNKILWFPVFC